MEKEKINEKYKYLEKNFALRQGQHIPITTCAFSLTIYFLSGVRWNRDGGRGGSTYKEFSLRQGLCVALTLHTCLTLPLTFTFNINFNITFKCLTFLEYATGNRLRVCHVWSFFSLIGNCHSGGGRNFLACHSQRVSLYGAGGDGCKCKGFEARGEFSVSWGGGTQR